MSEPTDNRNEIVSNLVKSSLTQVKKAQQTYIELSSKLMPTTGDDMEFKLKALDFARQDADAHLDFALKLLNAGDMAEVRVLQEAHDSSQTAEMARRVDELQSLAGSVSDAVAAAPVIDADECTIAAAAAAAVVGGAGVALQTTELDSSAIAAELEGRVSAEAAETMALNGTLDVAVAAGAAESDIAAEIEALAARIHEAKTRVPETRSATDEEIAAAVAAAELLDGDIEQAAQEEQGATPAANADTGDKTEVSADEPDHLLLASDEDVDVIEAAAELQRSLAATDADIARAEETLVAGNGSDFVEVIKAPLPPLAETVVAEASAPALVEVEAAPSAVMGADLEAVLAAPAGVEATAPVAAATGANVISNETTVGGKSFSLDLAAQLDAVRAMIRGNAAAEVAKDAAKAAVK